MPKILKVCPRRRPFVDRTSEEERVESLSREAKTSLGHWDCFHRSNESQVEEKLTFPDERTGLRACGITTLVLFFISHPLSPHTNTKFVCFI